MDSIRRIGSDAALAKKVAIEAVDQVRRQKQALDCESDLQKKSLRQLSQKLGREAAGTSLDSGARFERMSSLQRDIESVEGRLAELAMERQAIVEGEISADTLHRKLTEFDDVWESLTTTEQEQLIQVLIAKVGYDGQTGKVTVNFRSEGARAICQQKS